MSWLELGQTPQNGAQPKLEADRFNLSSIAIPNPLTWGQGQHFNWAWTPPLMCGELRGALFLILLYSWVLDAIFSQTRCSNW